MLEDASGPGGPFNVGPARPAYSEFRFSPNKCQAGSSCRGYCR
jgi:hypothetical protein